MDELDKKVERKNAMEDFLMYFKKVYSDNPTMPVQWRHFYFALQTYKVYEGELVKFNKKPMMHPKYGDYFISWKNHFKDNPNLQVYEDQRQNHFLQFNNASYVEPSYKLYLNFPADSVEDCVKILFDYIADNKMMTISKVSDCPRADSIVLRMVNKEDTIKVINFINDHPLLSSCARETNPFLMRSGVVGLAYDDWLSYNGMVAYMLQKYFSFKVTSNSLENISLGDFRGFIYKFYKDIIFNKDNLEQFLNDDYIKSELSNSKHISKGKFLSNVKDIFEMMAIEFDPAMDINHYFGMVDEFLKPQHYAANLNFFTKLLGERLDVNNYANHDSQAYEIFDKACAKILNEHDIEYLKMALNEALKGNYQYFDIGDMDKGKFDIYAIELLEKFREENKFVSTK